MTSGQPTKDGKKVVDCLKKGLKIAKQCMDPAVQTQLLVEILNHYVLFYEAGCENISGEMVQEVGHWESRSPLTPASTQVLGLVRGELSGLEQGEESDQISQHFSNTLVHMKLKQEGEGKLYLGVELAS